MTIKKKLYLAFSATFLVAVVTTTIGIASVQHLSAAIIDLSTRSEDATYDAGQIDTITSDLQAEQRGMLMRRYAANPEASDKLIDDNLASIASLHKFVESYRPLARNATVLAKLQIVSDNLAIVDRLNASFLDQVRSNDLSGALASLDAGLADATDKASAEGAELLDLQQRAAHEDGTSMIAEAVRDHWLMLLMLNPLIGVGALLAIVIRGLTRQLQRSTQELYESTQQIASAASQVAESSQSLAQGASRQAATIEETASASHEINSMARRASEGARSTVEVVTRSQENSALTDVSLNKMMTAMDGINESSQKISKIIKVIDEIAFQTNILALNAAVEAARAGQAGMGFAVVADEVRNLAQRCAQAASDTTHLIEESVLRASEGRETLARVADCTRAITSDSGKIKVLVDGISHGSEEQTRGIEQISKAIQDMESVTQGNAAGAEQSAAAAQQLTAQTQSMTETVAGLRKLIYSTREQEHLVSSSVRQRAT
jgi:methyl-accepting chemotaxis protein